MDVFTFLDPYLFMQNYYQLRKNHEENFSYSAWADELGLDSASTLRLMVNGKKKLSRGVAERFTEKFFSDKEEKNYFRLLISYAHAPTLPDKNATWSALSQILVNRIVQEEAFDYFTYISDLIIPKIQTLLSFEDAEWTVQKLTHVLDADPGIIESSLKKLETIGLALVYENNENVPCWKTKEKLLKVGDKLGDVALTAYHNASLEEAKSAQNLPKETRRYRSLLLPLSEDEFQNLMSEVDKFTKQLVAKFQASRFHGRKVYKLNLNYYPVTKEADLT